MEKKSRGPDPAPLVNPDIIITYGYKNIPPYIDRDDLEGECSAVAVLVANSCSLEGNHYV